MDLPQMRSLHPDSSIKQEFSCGVESVSQIGFPNSHHWILSGVLILTGSALFISAYPPWNMGLVTGWLPLVPLLAAVRSAPPMQAAIYGWFFGLAAYFGVFSWLFVVPGFHWYHFFLLDAYLAVYPALWSILVAQFLDRSFLGQLGLASAWVFMDYIRAHAGFLALPWITLAQSQVENTALLQTAGFFGEPAVTFLVVLGNLTIWNLVSGRRFSHALICALPVLAAMALGAFAVSSALNDSGLQVRVGALGTEFPARPHTPLPDWQARLDDQLKLLEQRLPPEVDIIALPESALVNPNLYPIQIGRLQQLAAHKQVTVIAGVAEATKFDHPQADVLTSSSRLRSGAWIFTPERDTPEKYEKSRLVPFAEEVPLRGWITWPLWLVPPLPEVTRGPTPRSYPVPGDIRVGIMICWESLFADHARTLIKDDATLLVMLANEGWFGGTAAGAQHNLTARMRAAETHRAVIVASNMGPPLVIDPFGRVSAGNSSDSGTHWATARVPIVTEKTFYSMFGDVFVLACGVFMLTYSLATRLRMRRV